MIKRTIYLFLLIINLGFSQKSDTIKFVYQKSIYRDIARDSVKKLYDKQYNYFFNIKNDFNTSRLMSFNCKFEDLDFFSIPMYRLYKDGYEKYNCSKNIEDFIVFNEYNKYQMVYICSKNNLYSVIDVPNSLIEQDKVYTSYKEDDRSEFLFTSYLETLFANEEVIKSRKIRIFNGNMLSNLFFKLYGLNDVIFEIEKSTGILYANIYHDETYGVTENRLPANDFIRKYIGEKVIKELCLNHYLEVDPSINADYYKPCEKIGEVNNKKYLKVMIKE